MDRRPTQPPVRDRPENPGRGLRLRVASAMLTVAVGVFTTVLTFEQAFRSGYSPARDPINLLGVGDAGPALAFNLALVALGVATGVFGYELPTRLGPERPVLVALGGALAFAGIFPVSYSFHWVFGLLLYVLPAAAIWIFLLRFALARNPRLLLLTVSTVTVSAAGLLALLSGAYEAIGAGAAERLIDYSGLVWGAVIGSVSARDPAPLLSLGVRRAADYPRPSGSLGQ